MFSLIVVAIVYAIEYALIGAGFITVFYVALTQAKKGEQPNV